MTKKLTLFVLLLTTFQSAYAQDSTAPNSASPAPAPATTPAPVNEIPVQPRNPAGVNDLAKTEGYELQWWSDAQTGLFNFRRCTTQFRRTVCEAPMLLNGLPQKDLPKFMAYYTERLDHWGSGHVSQLANVMMGSLGTATAYIGSFAALKIFGSELPVSVKAFFDSHKFKSGFHLASVGTIGVLVYFAGKNLLHSHRQKELRKRIATIEADASWKLPVEINSRALFEEFVSTLRQALYEYTHGGPPFDQSDNLIFQ